MRDNIKLSENLKIMIGGKKEVDVAKDMPFKSDYAVNSFFAIGHFQVEGHVIDYLYHLMSCIFPGQDPYVTYCFSITDETSGEYHQFSHAYPLKEVKISENELRIETPKGSISGTLDDLVLKSEIDSAALDLHLTAVGYPLFNAETGKFNLSGTEMYEYSIPRLISNGSIRVGDKTYGIKDGISWYDRQWEIKLPKLPAPVMNVASKLLSGKAGDPGFPTWGWMDLNLDNGDVISTWFAKTKDGEDCWATLMHPDGSHKMVRLNPVISTASDRWRSEASGQSYPMKYSLQIPELDADLTVECVVNDQELFFPERADLNHYEGAAQVKGTYLGKNTSGYTYVELVGNWE